MKRRSSSQLCETTTHSSASVTRLSSQGGSTGTLAGALASMWAAAACANTMHSSSELLARRLAPCRPVQATSPMASKPGRSVRPARSVSTPPQVKCAVGTTGMGCRVMSMPSLAQCARMLGKCACRNAGLWCEMSRCTQSRPCFFISKSMARATTSRGASSARGSCAGMKRVPPAEGGSSNRPPSPRTASLIRKVFSCGWYSPVGWNWMNSRLDTRQPARQAAAMPSPVAVLGLVV